MKISERKLRRLIKSVIMENNALLGPDTARDALALAKQLVGESELDYNEVEQVSETFDLDGGEMMNTGLKVTGKALQVGGGALLVASLAAYAFTKGGVTLDIALTNQILSTLNTPEGQEAIAFLLSGAIGAKAAFLGTGLHNLTK